MTVYRLGLFNSSRMNFHVRDSKCGRPQRKWVSFPESLSRKGGLAFLVPFERPRNVTNCARRLGRSPAEWPPGAVPKIFKGICNHTTAKLRKRSETGFDEESDHARKREA